MKAGLAAATIFIMTPIAVGITFLIGCGTSVYLDSAWGAVIVNRSGGHGTLILLAGLLSIGFPLVTLYLMLAWAFGATAREKPSLEPSKPNKHARG